MNPAGTDDRPQENTVGNWKRVQIQGTCPADQAAALRAALNPGRDFENFHCLVNGGAMGLPNWAAEKIEAVGNLAERGYDEESVANTLEGLAEKAPGLEVVVHVGADYEKDECVASVALVGGKATVTEPKVEKIPPTPLGQVQDNVMAQMTRPIL